MRSWLCRIAYPGLKPVWFGTVWVRDGAPQHEVEHACEAKVGEHLPPGYVVQIVQRGIMVMQQQDDEQ